MIILPRGGEDLVFHAKAIDSFDEFEKLCPPPEPPKKILPGGEKIENPQDPEFLKSMDNYGAKRLGYMVVKGLAEGTPDLEWEKVKLDNNTTWHLFREELRESGLSDVEVNRLVAGVMKANSLSEIAIEEARRRFLASQQAQDES
jgi:hypothetical protein